jgi:xylan 1,4-beta-xylosidase
VPEDAATISISLSTVDPVARFHPHDVSTVGIYDIDWLLTPPFERMLDLMASSLGGISGVRFFGIFSSGSPEMLKPESGGTVWLDPQDPPDFSVPFAALEALTSRGLTPFIALGFFPPAVSDSPVVPPVSFERWQELVSAFLTELATDVRFGADAIASWRFEVWNEPNEGRFWHGTFEQYLSLYQDTAEAVRRTEIAVRLGGPAMAYKPESDAEDGPDTLALFLEFLHAHPDIQCDFVSYHRKGTVDYSTPDPGRLWATAVEVEELVRSVVPERVPTLALINDEADEKIGFETPYAPRMDAFAASWMSTLASINVLRSESAPRQQPLPHLFFPDNANLQLMEAPFDGRRSIYIPFSNDDHGRLIKSAAAVWYDLLPLLEGTALQADSAGELLFPKSDLHIMATRTDVSCTVLATWFPPDEVDRDDRRTIAVHLRDVPWQRVNIIEYRIDGTHSNSYTAAGGSPETPVPVPEDHPISRLRLAQELLVIARTTKPVRPEHGTVSLTIELEPFATACFWLTTHDPRPIDPPANVILRAAGEDIDILWNPVSDRRLWGYEVERIGSDHQSVRLTKAPIRPVMVTDDPPPGDWRYRVRSLSCSNNASTWVDARPDGDRKS